MKYLLLILLSFAPKAFADVGEFCRQYQYVNDQVSCLEQFRGVSIPSAIEPICKQYQYLNDQIDCLKKFSNVSYVADNIVGLCRQYQYVNDQISCALKLKEISISDSAFATCSSYTYLNDRISCILKIGDAGPTDPSSSKKEIVYDLYKVIDDVEHDRFSAAISKLLGIIESLRRL